MWTVSGNTASTTRFGPFEPVEMLYEFDGPRIFTVRDADGELNLACWSDENERACRFIVAATSTAILQGLREGRLSVFDTLNQPRCWVCDTDHQGNLTECHRVDFDSIPRDALPAVGTMLLPSLEPLLTLRAVGDEIVVGRVPGSVIRTCVEGVQKAFKVLAEHVLGQQPQVGRPDEFLRRLFDLPTQRMAFRSFEISFRMPIEERNLFTGSGQKSPDAETLERVGAILNKGLKWLGSAAGEEGVYSPDAPEEGAVLLRALKELTPSSQGAIEQIEITGQLIGIQSRPVKLDRGARQRVNNAIRNRSLEPQLIDLEGRVRELDKDRLSFELREIDHPATPHQRFVFDEELLEEVFQAFQDDVRIRVAGRTFPVKNVAYALALSRTTTSPIDSAAD